MARARAAGKQIGRPASEVAQDTIDRIRNYRNEARLPWRAIAAALDEAGIPTPSGSARWRPATVADIYNRHATEESAA
jgi:hypothetical protein